MNKKFISLLIGIMCLSGCGKDNSSFASSQTSSIISENSLNSEASLNKLNTPSLTINEKTGVVSWEAIENAEYYNYIINDQEIKTTTSTILELEDKSNVSVQAVSNEFVSKWSNAVTYYDTSDEIVYVNNTYYNVYFHDANVEDQVVLNGEKANKPSNPTKENYTFDNWYEDPFYTRVFDFNQPIEEDIVVYAHYIPSALMDNVYYWVKANDKISSPDQGKVRDSGWKFIPLKEVENSNPKIFTCTVTVSNSSSTSPASFLVMDGLDDGGARNYYKNNGSDFSFYGDGTYRITFSLETNYGNGVQAKYEKITLPNYLNHIPEKTLTTPVVEVDNEKNLAYISEVEGASAYEVIIDNGEPLIITNNTITLNKGSHISVRATNGTDNCYYSNWSIPKANINIVYINIGQEEMTHAYVYFYESNQSAKLVEINTYVDELVISKEGYTFLGWYLDIAKTQKVEFPYLVIENVTFYPKWETKDNALTKEYYHLVDSNNNKIKGLTWNLDNYTFYEYETGEVSLEYGENYYIQTLDGTQKWGPYSVNEQGTYKIYFSEENIWNANTPKASNAYISKVETKLYFTNSLNWSGSIYAYMWDDATGDVYSTWPGTKMNYEKTNDYGQKIYSIDFDSSKYDRIIFNNGEGSQTCNITPSSYSYNGFFAKDEKDEKGRYKVGNYNFE